MSMVDTAPGKIQVRDLNFYYGKFHALKNINLDIAKNQVTAFIGPSGCGKTTTLRMIAGLETPTSGEIIIDGQTVFSSEKGIDVAMIFKLIKENKIPCIFDFLLTCNSKNLILSPKAA